MKRLSLIIVALCMSFVIMSAQDKEQRDFLPKAGDWAISIDAKPLLNFVGNLFNNTSDNDISSFGGGEPTLLNGPTASIMCKYMLTDNFALKTNVGVLISNSKIAGYVSDDAASMLDPLADAKVADIRNTRTTGLSLMAGAEYRIGKKKIQGVFGGGLLIGVEEKLQKYQYGNAVTEINQTPTSYFTTAAYRPLKNYSQTPDVFAGLVGTIGVEYFISPKIALGTEVSLCMGYSFKQQTYELSEGYNQSTKNVEERVNLISPSTSSFSMETKNLGGSLYLSFYF